MDEEITTDESFIVRVDLEVSVTDPEALERSALTINEGTAANPAYLEEGRELVREGPRSAVVVAVDGAELLDSLDGIECVALEVSTPGEWATRASRSAFSFNRANA